MKKMENINDPKLDEKSMDDAVEGALLATLAYREYEGVLLRRHPNAIIINNKNARAVLIDRGDFLDVLFAGSDDYKDWLGNIFFRNKVKRGGIGEVFKGVADYYALLQDKIHANIANPMKPQRIFAHSLGGACAEMYAARRTMKDKPILCLHTYGAPMVGDEDFCKASQKIPNAFNWWNKGDVVPYQPKFAALISIGYSRARLPRLIDGIKILRKVPFWTPPIMKFLRKGLAHAIYDGYYEALLKIQKVIFK